MKLNWSHAVIRVRDADAVSKFYCEVLDFSVSDRGHLGPDDTGPEIVFLTGSSSDHHQIAFVDVRGPEEATSLDHTAFRVGSISDVKEMIRRVAADESVPDGVPLTHGNAISVYFKDPEGNGIEVFCDSPWHVKQPQGKVWDPTKSDDEILSDVEALFRDEPEFSPMAAYHEKRAADFGEG
jgi:catechol-2,3-dioxygenase